MEICWYNGRRILNSENANYSYGSLEKALILGLSNLHLKVESPILILGFGGGSVVRPLRNIFACKGKITAVDWDEVVLSLARDEFGVVEGENLEIVQEDARYFVKTCSAKFGLIIVDLFLDREVPETFYRKPFWEDLIQLAEPGARILFNAGIDKGGSGQISDVEAFLSQIANVSIMNNVERHNTLLLAECIG